MKPTSIIFLIVAAALIIAGFVTCIVASNAAEKEGVQLFETVTETGDYVESRNLDSSAVSRIVIRVGNADVHVIGGADHSYLEMVNFPSNSYQYSQSGSVVTMADTVDYSDLTSLMSFFTEGFHFDGLRQYFRFQKQEERQKQVNLYLSDADLFKKAEIRVGTGSVTVEKIAVALDYQFEIGHGNLEMRELPFSVINATVSDGGIRIDGTDANGSLDLRAAKGDIAVTLPHLNSRTVDLTATLGMVRYENTDRGHNYSKNPLISTDTLKAVAENGNITYSVAAYIPVETDPVDSRSSDSAEPQEEAVA